MTKNNPWDRLGVGEARRVNSQGKYDFFWIMLEGLRPGLILKLDEGQLLVEPLPILRSIDTRYRLVGDRLSFVLSLGDNGLSELFEALCRNIADGGEQAANHQDALFHTVQRTRRWHHLLRGGSTGELTLEEQRGLIGEIAFLQELAAMIGPEAAIEAWKGPDGASKDFEFPNICVELKARRSAAKPYVAISSVEQLADVDGARVFLRVTDVTAAMTPEGLTLHDHVAATLLALQTSAFAVARFDQMIFDFGYDPVHKYDGRRWFIGESREFEVLEGFPRIVSPIASGVTDVRYSIGLAECAPYALAEPLLDIIREESA
ncbi:PD-(D/E)XK motif protein [Rhizobium sp. WSM1274]|uniref:PD-(D/E)XK motif protein n=1 Tax=Rhizobium sp. WSM1274 TaxID=3138254 RepID=UPI0021A8A509|nr:PD-(D/E)XK motif protein [Rhizobium leguminosarum]UWU29142.1 PD-(D/E)XK motif protein [Rhizobium leguminosarum bv. viciae]